LIYNINLIKKDREADQIYDLVEKHMDNRRKARREVRLKEEMKKIRLVLKL
jgi:pre-mRNA-processing factor 6